MKTARNATLIKQAAEHRSRGAKILRNSLVIGLVGAAPLLLYVLLGPADGNPIGLGLLAIVAVPIAIVGGVIGALIMMVERLKPRGN